MQTKDTAICLRAVNYSETSQVVTLFTKDNGKVPAMAKGSRRAKSSFDGPIEVFSFGDVVFTLKDSGGQLAILTEFEQQPRFQKFQQDLYTLHAALFSAELTEKFLEDRDPHPALFDKFLKFLQTLQQTQQESEVLAWLILYQLRLLEETGVAPVLDACVNCGTYVEMWPKRRQPPQGWHPASEINQSRDSHGAGKCSPPAKGQSRTAGRGFYFSSRENGLLCANCEQTFPEKRAIDAALIEILNAPAKLPKTEMRQLKKIESLLIYHLTELLHKPPRMAKYF